MDYYGIFRGRISTGLGKYVQMQKSYQLQLQPIASSPQRDKSLHSVLHVKPRVPVNLFSSSSWNPALWMKLKLPQFCERS